MNVIPMSQPMWSQVSCTLAMHQFFLVAAARAADNLRGVGGFEPPAWHDLRLGARPPPTRTDDVAFHGCGDGSVKQRPGWRKTIASFRSSQHSPSQNVLCCVLRAEQAGGVAFSAIPSCPLMRINTPLFPRLAAPSSPPSPLSVLALLPMWPST